MDLKDKFWIGVFLSVVIPGATALLSLFIETLGTSVIVAAFTAIILVYLTFLFRYIAGEFSILTEFVQNQAVIRQVWEADFYESWRTDVEKASRRVDITYFDNKDPRKSTDTEKKDYYESFGEVVKRKATEGVEFRRLVRANPNLEDWIDDIIDEHTGTSRYSLACIPDPDPETGSLPHVSVQLIDDEIAYFVAVGQQMEGSTPRDLYVRSAEMNSQWGQYYDKLWNESFEILRRGTLQETEYEKFTKFLESVENNE